MTVQIPLTRGLVALVDDEDAGWLSRFKWCAMPKRLAFYAMRTVYGGKSKTVYMHRLILGAPQGVEVDHINMNALDNRRGNLRLCTGAENKLNRRAMALSVTGLKGVSPSRGGYMAMIKKDGKSHFLGRFPTPEEAHEAYRHAAAELHGEFARVA